MLLLSDVTNAVAGSSGGGAVVGNITVEAFFWIVCFTVAWDLVDLWSNLLPVMDYRPSRLPGNTGKCRKSPLDRDGPTRAAPPAT